MGQVSKIEHSGKNSNHSFSSKVEKLHYYFNLLTEPYIDYLSNFICTLSSEWIIVVATSDTNPISLLCFSLVAGAVLSVVSIWKHIFQLYYSIILHGIIINKLATEHTYHIKPHQIQWIFTRLSQLILTFLTFINLSFGFINTSKN